MAQKARELTASYKEKIFKLFDSGFSSVDICKVVGRSSGTMYHFIKHYVA
jgi:hypothetical protein